MRPDFLLFFCVIRSFAFGISTALLVGVVYNAVWRWMFHVIFCHARHREMCDSMQRSGTSPTRSRSFPNVRMLEKCLFKKKSICMMSTCPSKWFYGTSPFVYIIIIPLFLCPSYRGICSYHLLPIGHFVRRRTHTTPPPKAVLGRYRYNTIAPPALREFGRTLTRSPLRKGTTFLPHSLVPPQSSYVSSVSAGSTCVCKMHSIYLGCRLNDWGAVVETLYTTSR